MDLFEVIDKRHSYRGPFAQEMIPRNTLREIVEAGIKAPSGKNAQTTEFVIIDDNHVVRQINELHTSNVAVQQARAFIACIVDRVPVAIYETHNFQVEDCAAAVENMLLAITAKGLASVWIDGWLRTDGRAEKIGGWLDLPAEKIVRVLLPLGVPVEAHQQKARKPFQERAWFNRYRADL